MLFPPRLRQTSSKNELITAVSIIENPLPFSVPSLSSPVARLTFHRALQHQGLLQVFRISDALGHLLHGKEYRVDVVLSVAGSAR